MFNSDISLEIHYGQSNRLVATELFKFPKEGLAEIVVALRKTEKAMAPHSSTFAWKIPWTEEPGRLQSMGSLKSQTRLSNFNFTFHFPSPVHESEKCKWSRSVVSDFSGPMDCSLPGSSVHGIFQARVLEWVAIAFSINSPKDSLKQCDPISPWMMACWHRSCVTPTEQIAG